MSDFLQGKKIVLGITGGIAAYKSAELIRAIKKEGGRVFPIMTASAKKFITKLTLATLSNEKVFDDEIIEKKPLAHIELISDADLFLLYPATANTIARVSLGLADDFLTATFLAASCPKIVCPAMNDVMWNAPQTKEHICRLRDFGMKILEPIEGQLASYKEGIGHICSLEDVLKEVAEVLDTGKSILKSKNVLICTGPTREYIDDVRFISNKATSKLGYLLAKEALKMGANLTYIIAGDNYVLPKAIRVDSTDEMFKALKKHFFKQDIVFMVAAISDISFEKVKGKIKKEDLLKRKFWQLRLNPDLLAWCSDNKEEKQILVGFSLNEKGNLHHFALKKLEKKKTDFLVASDLKDLGTDFISPQIYDCSGKVVFMADKLTKEVAAKQIFQLLLKKMKSF